MRIVCEIDLVGLGSVCGVIAHQGDAGRDQIAKSIRDAGCPNIMFCFRGAEDIHTAEMVMQFVNTCRYCRSILVYNPSLVKRFAIDAQVFLDRLLSKVDMVLPLQWRSEDLLIAVAIHSDKLLLPQDERNADLLRTLEELDYQGVMIDV